MNKFLATLLLTSGMFCTGCGDQSATVDRAKELTSKAGRAIGEGAGMFVSGIDAGYEQAVTTFDVRVARELLNIGVAVTIAKNANGGGTNGFQKTLSFYIINKQPVNGTLRIKLLNAATQEIGRATAVVSLPPDTARYVPFTIDREIPLPMTRFVELDLKKE